MAAPSPIPRPPLTPSAVLLTAQTLLVVVVSAWAGGGRLSWAPPVLLALTALTLPLWLLRRREGGPARGLALLPAALWVLFIALALLNPSHGRAPDGSWHERAGWVRWLPTTVDREHTLAGALPWLAALVQGGALAGLGLPTRAARFLWGGVALNGFALAATGAVFQFAGADQMLGALAVPEPTYFFATFFYKNHWAAYGALGGIAGGALALADWREALAGRPAARGRVLFFGGAALLTLCTLPLPGSRAGLVLAVLLIGAFAARAGLTLWCETEGDPAAGRWGAGFLLMLVLVIAGFGAHFYAERGRADWTRTQAQLARHAAGGMLDLRVELSRDTWRMARARPVFGWGCGCYEIVFPVFQGDYLRDAQGRATARFEFAHNDWLQVLAENGIAGAALLLSAAGLLARRTWGAAGRAGRWALGGAAVVAVYAWIDFPFHNPAVLLLWTVLVASAGRLNRGQEGERSRVRRPQASCAGGCV